MFFGIAGFVAGVVVGVVAKNQILALVAVVKALVVKKKKD